MDDQLKRPLTYVGWLSLCILLAYILASLFKGYIDPGDLMLRRSKERRDAAREKSQEKGGEMSAPKDTTQQEPLIADTTSNEFSDDFEPEINPPGTDESSFAETLKDRSDSIRSTLTNGRRRTDVIIRYYPHLSDGELVYELSELGFYLHERPTDSSQLMMPTNSVFYGDNVPLEDIQLVTFELLSKGLEIKQISMSRFHDNWKANSIEIGTDVSVKDLPVLTLQDVQAFRKVSN